MAKTYICPVCGKTFEKVLNSNFVVLGAITCSKKCFDDYVNAKNVTKTEVKAEIPNNEKPAANPQTPKPAVKKRKTTKTN